MSAFLGIAVLGAYVSLMVLRPRTCGLCTAATFAALATWMAVNQSLAEAAHAVCVGAIWSTPPFLLVSDAKRQASAR
ncbi:MAG: hypothetical protein U1E73_03045 [Planctomycetota bacterium]